MNTEEEIAQLKNEIAELKRQFQFHAHTGLDSQSLPGLPLGLANAPQASIAAPSGGATIDGAARGAINTIIATMVTLGLINS